MNQHERRRYLTDALLHERGETEFIIPAEETAQKRLLRSLFNLRMPAPASEEFLRIQDAYLREEIQRKSVTDYHSLTPVEDGIYLWQGDITTLLCDAVVNAANSQMLGCFCPCHGCIDNAIHTYAGVRLRLSCAELMRAQGHEEETGKAKITPAFNLPSRFVIHTVGPIVSGALTKKDCELLSSCYRSCLETARENGLKSIAFCCISTGEFHFPNEKAAEIAVNTVKKFKEESGYKIEVIFNVFKDNDYQIYRRLLGAD